RTRNNLNHWMTPTDRWLGRVCNHLVTRTVVNCDAARRAVLRDERPAPGSVLVLENGVDLERFPTPLAGHVRPGARVGVVANLRPVKGLDVFVRAAALGAGVCSDATFHLAGEGELRPALERQVRELGLGQRVVFHGSVADVPGFLDTLAVG